jgi:hypothetical protein
LEGTEETEVFTTEERSERRHERRTPTIRKDDAQGAIKKAAKGRLNLRGAPS